VDRRDLAYLAVRSDQWLPCMAHDVFCNVACFGECDVCLYLAFFDNAVALNWLVTTQAAMTVVGNCTVCASAWWIWRQSLSFSESGSDSETFEKTEITL